MTPLSVLKQAEGTVFVNEDGDRDELKLLPPLSAAELEELDKRIPCPLPQEIRELLCYARGFEGVLEAVGFSGVMRFGFFEEIFPCAIPIAHDGFGNYWVVDLTPASTTWGPIFFACHDPAVLVFQTDSLSHFISEIIRFGNDPWQSEIDDVHEGFAMKIRREDPEGSSYQACISSADPELRIFASSLDETWRIIDLRQPNVGDGFAWRRFRRELKRFGDKRIFAYRNKKSLLRKLLGG